LSVELAHLGKEGGSVGVELWTDGGCIGNPGPGAWAFILRWQEGEVARSGYEPETTNNRMEMMAVLGGLRELADREALRGGPVLVVTDSQYVHKGMTQWMASWVRSGWKTSAKKPVKNQDLWMALAEAARGLALEWKWVMGHAGNSFNERCHSLVEAAVAEGKRGS
jgi:ribonuclease HI